MRWKPVAEELSVSAEHILEWSRPPANMTLADDEVHVWRADLKLHDSQQQSLRRLLSDDEGNRADRFYFEKDRDRFVAARGLLRMILSEYLHVPADTLQFSYSRHGKPSLKTKGEGGGVRFNVSHSHDMALYAVSRNREVGVDIESIRPRSFYEEIAERFFSTDEIRWLREIAEEKKPEAFCECWTMKEAYLKARGEGIITFPAKSPAMPRIPNSALAEQSIIVSPEDDRSWSLWRLEPGSGYKGALVVEGACRKLQRFHWSSDAYDNSSESP